MKKIFLNSILLVAIMLFSIRCSDFGDINIDPNNTTSVAPSALLTSSLRSVADVISATVPVRQIAATTIPFSVE